MGEKHRSISHGASPPSSANVANALKPEAPPPDLPELEAAFPEKTPIRIAKVYTTANPEKTEAPCTCGGMLSYGTFSYSAAWNGQRLEVGEVEGYKCDQDDCSVIFFLPSVAREMEYHIDKARNDLSPFQKLAGLINKRYRFDPEDL